MNQLTVIIKDDERLPGTIAVGWRIYFPSGEHHDILWGNTKNHDSLQRLVHDPDWRKHEPPISVVDERVETQGAEPLVTPDWWKGGDA